MATPIRWTETALAAAAIALTLGTAAFAGDEVREVTMHPLRWDDAEANPSWATILFWSCGFASLSLITWDRVRQARVATAQQARVDQQLGTLNAALSNQQTQAAVARMEAAESAAEVRTTRQRVEELQALQAANEQALARVRVELADERVRAAEFRVSSDRAARELQDAHAKLLVQVETLPPRNTLINHAWSIVQAVNWADDAVRTESWKADTATLNDRIRVTLAFMARTARLYHHDPDGVSFGAHLLLFYPRLHHARGIGWDGEQLPSVVEGKIAGYLVTMPELSIRLDAQEPARDPTLRAAAWPVGPAGTGVPPGQRSRWLPGPQWTWVTQEGSRVARVEDLDSWVRARLLPYNQIAWKTTRSYIAERNGTGMASWSCFPITQYELELAPGGRLKPLAHLGVVQVYATRAGLIASETMPRDPAGDVRADRLASLLMPFRALLALMLIRRAELDLSRPVTHERRDYWHGC